MSEQYPVQAEPKEEPHPLPAGSDWARTDLLQFGWMSGDYCGGKCRDCGCILPCHVKQAFRCAPCAVQAKGMRAVHERALDIEYGKALTPAQRGISIFLGSRHG